MQSAYAKVIKVSRETKCWPPCVKVTQLTRFLHRLIARSARRVRAGLLLALQSQSEPVAEPRSVQETDSPSAGRGVLELEIVINQKLLAGWH